MKIITSHYKDNAPDSQENWDKIKSWWYGLNGKDVEWVDILGTQGDVNGKQEILSPMTTSTIIKSPSLEDNRLKCIHDNKPLDILVEKLELDTNQNLLKVYSSDSKQYIFIDKSGLTVTPIFS